MTATQYNYNRRNSSTTPYTIPIKVQQQQHANHIHHHSHHNPLSPTTTHMNSPPISHTSSSVPTLSREFVVRRISEGETGRLKEELRCEACGKGYKHISSLAKHLWEHTPEWNVTKRLSISKHQQVQLLEAASILVAMNEPTTTATTTTTTIQSHHQPQTSINSNYSDESPFSPSNSADSNLTNHTTPTPPITDDQPPTFKQTFTDIEDTTFTNSAAQKDINVRSNYARMNSISQYPPSHAGQLVNHPSSPALNGGYLDDNSSSTSPHHSSIHKQNEPPSASASTTTIGIDDLKSPSPSYKAVPSSISKSPILVNFTKLEAGVKTEDHENAIEDDEEEGEEIGIKPDRSFEEEEVVGKMED